MVWLERFPASVSEQEIHHLIDYIGNSGCQFYRNGKWYDAKKARDHLELKYNLARNKGRLETTDDFIDKVASGKSFTTRRARSS
jgi:hypothetical protein